VVVVKGGGRGGVETAHYYNRQNNANAYLTSCVNGNFLLGTLDF
jgi:hypothetical protein